MYTLNSKPECAFHHFSCDCIKSFYISCHFCFEREREMLWNLNDFVMLWCHCKSNNKTHTEHRNQFSELDFSKLYCNPITLKICSSMAWFAFSYCHLLEMFSIIWSKMSIFLFCFSLISFSKCVAKMLGGGSGIGAMVVWCESAYNIPNCE